MGGKSRGVLHFLKGRRRGLGDAESWAGLGGWLYTHVYVSNRAAQFKGILVNLATAVGMAVSAELERMQIHMPFGAVSGARPYEGGRRRWGWHRAWLICDNHAVVEIWMCCGASCAWRCRAAWSRVHHTPRLRNRLMSISFELRARCVWRALVRGLALLSLVGWTVQAGRCETAGGNPTVDEILKTWEARPASLPPFMYKAHVSEVATAYRKVGDDPFRDLTAGPAQGYVTADKDIVIKWQGKRFRTRITGDHIDLESPKAYRQEEQFAFNGKHFQMFIASSQSRAALGHFGKPERLRMTPVTLGFGAIVTWRDPKGVIPQSSDARKRELGVDLQGIAVKALVDGRPCVELKSLHLGRPIQSAWVKPESPYLPVKISRFGKNGRETAIFQMRYADDGVGGERLSSWSETYFNEKYEVTRRIEGVVQEFKQGTSFENQEFDLSYPPGARIVAYTSQGPMYFIQSLREGMKAVTAKEYKKLNAGDEAPKEDAA